MQAIDAIITTKTSQQQLTLTNSENTLQPESTNNVLSNPLFAYAGMICVYSQNL